MMRRVAGDAVNRGLERQLPGGGDVSGADGQIAAAAPPFLFVEDRFAGTEDLESPALANRAAGTHHQRQTRIRRRADGVRSGVGDVAGEHGNVHGREPIIPKNGKSGGSPLRS